MSKAKKKKPKKLKNYVININYSCLQRRYFEASSIKEARQMYEDGNFDSEYDFEECCENDEISSIEEVK